jgi:fumarate hydratase class I
MLPSFRDSLLELITRTSTDLPPDVRAAMGLALSQEDRSTRAGQALTVIAQNIDQAASCEGPICQDTGMPTFEVKVPVGANQIWMKQQIRDAVVEATRRGKLRPNSVDSITGENSGNNLGPGMPIVHFEQWERDVIEVKLILKGGGCENTNAQYALPAELDHLGRADRSLEGVRKCILHAVWKAQGKGCSPGAVGVCIGGDRTSGYLHAKEQLFRTLDDTNSDPRLADLERRIMDEANTLTVGPMGFGGKTSLIGCKIGALNHLPASFFVSIAYDCWAFRRLGVVLDAASGAIQSWLYREGTAPSTPLLKPEEIAAGFPMSGREVRLTAPISEEQIRALHVGDVVLISGRMFTGRDAVHAYLTKHDAPVDLRGGVLYHCGPVLVKEGDAWKVTAAGPTTSIREEPYQADIIGKGGMGAKTLAGLKESGAVYLNAIGGAAQFYARAIQKVTGVSLMEFGTPEAMWHLEVKDFPAIVTMDAHGNSLHKDIEEASGVQLEAAAGG